jgi:hypothetical protein
MVQRCAPSGMLPGAEDASGARESRVDCVNGRVSRVMNDGKLDIVG